MKEKLLTSKDNLVNRINSANNQTAKKDYLSSLGSTNSGSDTHSANIRKQSHYSGSGFCAVTTVKNLIKRLIE
jgi:hypothetical protein